MINWLISIGLSADIADKVKTMINLGLSISSVIAFLSTLGLGTAVLQALKGIFKKKGAEAVAA